MGSATHLEILLRKKLSRFLVRRGQIGAAVSVLKSWEELGWGPVLFGGVIRDLLIFGGRHYPRDVDVVLRSAGTAALENELSHFEHRRNRFGGFHLNVSRWSFDVWQLERTWAFSHDVLLSPAVENLPKTTFLDVEAIAVTLSGPNRVGRIYSNGFFEAVERRCIDINYRANPYPALSAIRAIVTACKLRYRISAKLADYFVQTVHDQGPAALVDAQEQHYQKVLFRATDVVHLQTHFLSALGTQSNSVIPLPDAYHPTQLSLWHS